MKSRTKSRPAPVLDLADRSRQPLGFADIHSIVENHHRTERADRIAGLQEQVLSAQVKAAEANPRGEGSASRARKNDLVFIAQLLASTAYYIEDNGDTPTSVARHIREEAEKRGYHTEWTDDRNAISRIKQAIKLIVEQKKAT